MTKKKVEDPRNRRRQMKVGLRILPAFLVLAFAALLLRSGDFVLSIADLASTSTSTSPGSKNTESAGSSSASESQADMNRLSDAPLFFPPFGESAYSSNEEKERIINTETGRRSAFGRIDAISPQAGESKTADSADTSEKEADTHTLSTESDKGDGGNTTSKEMDRHPDIQRKWQDAVDTGLDVTKTEESLLLDIAKVRERLETKENQLEQREALLQAAERELEQKLTELSILRDEIAKLLEEQSAEEEARTESLVKIYTGMKAEDAARIFNTLDLDIVVDIMTRMSERKTGPILAEMDSEKARLVTIMMAEENKLPEVPGTLVGAPYRN